MAQMNETEGLSRREKRKGATDLALNVRPYGPMIGRLEWPPFTRTSISVRNGLQASLVHADNAVRLRSQDLGPPFRFLPCSAQVKRVSVNMAA